MAKITLQGMSFFAHHGYYAHERVRGGNYLIDVSMDADIDQAALTDDLHATVNYEIVYRICNDIMEQPVRLIETLAYRIAHELQKEFPDIKNIQVLIHKLNPELGGAVQSAQVRYVL